MPAAARAFLTRIERAENLPANVMALADAGFELRNLLSHPRAIGG